jgi:hypothetical protein
MQDFKMIFFRIKNSIFLSDKGVHRLDKITSELA